MWVTDLVQSVLSELLDWPSSLVFKNPQSKRIMKQQQQQQTLRIMTAYIMYAHICVCMQRSEDNFRFDTESAVCLLHGIPEILPFPPPITPQELGLHILMLCNGLFCAARGSEPGSPHLLHKHFYPRGIIISYYFLIL